MLYAAFFEVVIDAADGLTDWDIEQLAVEKIADSFRRSCESNDPPEYECEISSE